MSMRLQWPAWLILAAIFSVIMAAAWHSSARAEALAVRLTLAPADAALPALERSAPFGLRKPALAAEPAEAMAAKWQAMQNVIAIESRAIAACGDTLAPCSPAALRFKAIVDMARRETGRARAGLINRAVNLAIRPMRDSVQFGAADVWQSPLMTFANGAGDCEDYAIAKYVALREAGVSADDLKLVIVHDARVGEDHAIAAARIDGDWIVLDNRKMLLLTDTQARDLTPLIALGEEAPSPALMRDAGVDWQFVPMAAAIG